MNECIYEFIEITESKWKTRHTSGTFVRDRPLSPLFSNHVIIKIQSILVMVIIMVVYLLAFKVCCQLI